MTAYRLIDNHKELQEIGSHTHDEIDIHIDDTSFVVSSGSINVPRGARTLSAGIGLNLFDEGPGNRLILSLASTPSSTTMSWMEIPTGDIDGVNMEYTLLHEPNPPTSLMLYINGVLQSGNGNDFFLSGNKFLMNYSPTDGSNIFATYSYLTLGSFVSWVEIPEGDIDGLNKDFSLREEPTPPDSLMLYLNGILQKQGSTSDYLLSGKNISFNQAPLSGSNISSTYPY